MIAADFMNLIVTNPINARLLEELPRLGLPKCTLTAGCLFQTIWNHKSGNQPEHGIKDYDIFYFDEDLSWEAENAAIHKAKDLLGDIGHKVEIKNQARVHLWYHQKFGKSYPQLGRVEDGIDLYLISCTRFGINVSDKNLYAPDGFEDVWNGILRMNPKNAQPDLFVKKCNEYRVRWPWLTLE